MKNLFTPNTCNRYILAWIFHGSVRYCRKQIRRITNMASSADPKNGLINCNLCSRLKDDPRIIGVCHHSFCLACIKEYCQITTDDRGQTISICPQCHLNFEVPEGGFESLKKNEFVIKFRDCYLSSVLCNICSNEMVVYRCEECEEHYCDKCSAYHLKFKATREHKLTRVGENSKLNECLMCQLHLKEINMLCSRCSTFVCICCYTEQHNGHAVLLINDWFEKVKKHFSDVAFRKHAVIQVVSERISALNSIDEIYNERANAVHGQIVARGEKAKGVIDSKVFSLCKALDEELDYHREDLKSKIQNLETIKRTLQFEIADYEDKIRQLNFKSVADYPGPLKVEAGPVIPDYEETFDPMFQTTQNVSTYSDDLHFGKICESSEVVDKFKDPPVPSASKSQSSPASSASQTLKAHESSREDKYTPAFKPRAGEAQVTSGRAFRTILQESPYTLQFSKAAQLSPFKSGSLYKN